MFNTRNVVSLTTWVKKRLQRFSDYDIINKIGFELLLPGKHLKTRFYLNTNLHVGFKITS